MVCSVCSAADAADMMSAGLSDVNIYLQTEACAKDESDVPDATTVLT